MGIFETISRTEHEQVVFCQDTSVGLKAIIAIHNTALGPALGGCRLWNYSNEEEALQDVLRLSRGMTYKAAISGLNLGGGKAVIIGDSKLKSEKLFRAFGRFVESLNGRYITAEDVGTNVYDMEYVRMETKHVTGILTQAGGLGDPSPNTAYGVYCGILACLKWRLNEDKIAQKTVAVQGVGNVGYHLIKHLVENQARVIACDVSTSNLARLKKDFPMVEIVSPDNIYDSYCDIFSPCALGGVINDNTIPRLKCTIIAGSANNVLLDEEKHAQALREKNILYAPDYVINAGGLKTVDCEIRGLGTEYALTQASTIYNALLDVFQMAQANGLTTKQAADQKALQRIAQITRLRQNFIA